MAIVLDAEKMQTRSQAHPYLMEQLQFPDYYGKNLDALFDCLTDLGPTQIRFINEERGGDFFRKIRRVFKDAQKANPDLTVMDSEEMCCGSAGEMPEETCCGSAGMMPEEGPEAD